MSDAKKSEYKDMPLKEAFKKIQDGTIYNTLPLIWEWPSSKVLELMRMSTRLPVIHEEKALEQCAGEYSFVVELLDEFLQEQTGPACVAIEKSIKENDHKAFMHHSHSIKGVARNLYLTALSTVLTEMDWIGKVLIRHEQNIAESRSPCDCEACKLGFDQADILKAREPCLKEFIVEIDRLKKKLDPELREKASAEEDDEEFEDD